MPRGTPQLGPEDTPQEVPPACQGAAASWSPEAAPRPRPPAPTGRPGVPSSCGPVVRARAHYWRETWVMHPPPRVRVCICVRTRVCALCACVVGCLVAQMCTCICKCVSAHVCLCACVSAHVCLCACVSLCVCVLSCVYRVPMATGYCTGMTYRNVSAMPVLIVLEIARVPRCCV